MGQLVALGIEPRDQDSAAKSLATLKTELIEEKATREIVQAKNETLIRAVEDLKNTADTFATQIPILEEKIKHLDSKVLDKVTELRAQELNLERTTKVKNYYKNQNAQLTRKLECKLLFLCRFCLCLV
jgi:chromosome segregation ATPase